MNRVERQGVRADFEVLRGGVLVVEWRGLVLLPAAEAVKRAICNRLTAAPVAVVSDYRAAVLAMSDSELRAIMVGGAHDLPDVPAFVVAADADCAALYRAAFSAVLRGRWRHVSRDFGQALRLATQWRPSPSLPALDRR